MSWDGFIEKNVYTELVKQGHSPAIAQGGACEAVALYRRMSQASRKGMIFDDVLRHAKLWAEKRSLPVTGERKRRTRKSGQNELF